MIKDRRVLAVIPARGGSKGVPRKNLKYLLGKPLIQWTIEAALQSKYIDRAVLSSEDNEIIQVAKKLGCDVPFVRPKSLAEDETSGIEPILHAIEQLPKYDYVVLLQPTSPQRNVFDIDACIEQCVQSQAPACISVKPVKEHPSYMVTKSDDNKINYVMIENKVHRRQDLPNYYILNGAVYVAEIPWLKKEKTFITDETRAYVMPEERSLDIDSEYDFLVAERMLSNRQEKD